MPDRRLTLMIHLPARYGPGLATALLLSACVTLARPYEEVGSGSDFVLYRAVSGGSGVAPVGQQVGAAAARHCAGFGREAVLEERSESSEALYLRYSCRVVGSD